jgi:AcrR family transcriptional regulator
MPMLEEKIETREAKPIPQPEPGRREKQKARRLLRIKDTARALFLTKGYDRTTLRMIAARAKVGAATIFRYVEDKRDLLMLIFDEDHRVITEEAMKTLSDDLPFVELSLAGFRPYYSYFATNPEFSRAILREAPFYRFNPRLGLTQRRSMARSIARIKLTVEIGRRRKEILVGEDDEVLALLIFEIYQNNLRRWLHSSERPGVERGLAELRRALSLVMNGLGRAG